MVSIADIYERTDAAAPLSIHSMNTYQLTSCILLHGLGGPVTHLYESLTGNGWEKHGESKYCCFSVYSQTVGDDKWDPLVVNRVIGATKITNENDDDSDKGKTKTFAWD